MHPVYYRHDNVPKDETYQQQSDSQNCIWCHIWNSPLIWSCGLGRYYAGQPAGCFYTLKRAIQILANLQTRDLCRQAFWEFQILTVVNIYILHTVTHINLKSPELAIINTQLHNYNNRHVSDYCFPLHHLISTEEKPTYKRAKLWKANPEELKKTERQKFGRQFKPWLQQHPVYPLREFFEMWETSHSVFNFLSMNYYIGYWFILCAFVKLSQMMFYLLHLKNFRWVWIFWKLKNVKIKRVTPDFINLYPHG